MGVVLTLILVSLPAPTKGVCEVTAATVARQIHGESRLASLRASLPVSNPVVAHLKAAIQGADAASLQALQNLFQQDNALLDSEVINLIEAFGIYESKHHPKENLNALLYNEVDAEAVNRFESLRNQLLTLVEQRADSIYFRSELAQRLHRLTKRSKDIVFKAFEARFRQEDKIFNAFEGPVQEKDLEASDLNDSLELAVDSIVIQPSALRRTLVGPALGSEALASFLLYGILHPRLSTESYVELMSRLAAIVNDHENSAAQRAFALDILAKIRFGNNPKLHLVQTSNAHQDRRALKQIDDEFVEAIFSVFESESLLNPLVKAAGAALNEFGVLADEATRHYLQQRRAYPGKQQLGTGAEKFIVHYLGQQGERASHALAEINRLAEQPKLTRRFRETLRQASTKISADIEFNRFLREGIFARSENVELSDKFKAFLEQLESSDDTLKLNFFKSPGVGKVWTFFELSIPKPSASLDESINTFIETIDSDHPDIFDLSFEMWASSREEDSPLVSLGPASVLKNYESYLRESIKTFLKTPDVLQRNDPTTFAVVSALLR